MSGEHFYIRNGLAHNVLSEMADVFEDEQLDGISPDMPDTRYCMSRLVKQLSLLTRELAYDAACDSTMNKERALAAIEDMKIAVDYIKIHFEKECKDDED